MTRSEFLSNLVGRPWSRDDGNCWGVAAFVQFELFNRVLPHASVPAGLSDFAFQKWVLREIDAHPERALWREVPAGPMGLIGAGDGALCLMGHLRGPAHIGVWLRPEQRVVHCGEETGVCFETILALRQQGWKQLNFYEPACP